MAEGIFDGGRRDPSEAIIGVMSALPPAGRFAPSPTGDLHLGNLRTAVLAWLFARFAGARFLVRMEDLDSGRVRPRAAERQLADLAALGLDWDGTVEFQSERTEVYESAVDRLRAADLVYECFCTRAEIREAVSAPHGLSPDGAYPGTCARLSDEERARRSNAGRRAALRVRAGGTEIEFHDRIMGPRRGRVDDFVVRRTDGAFAYNLAVVVDDAAQGIDEVVRGADLLDTTPRQLRLAGLLQLEAPRFAHVPLVLGPDGARLAKRHGSVTLRDMAPELALRWIASSLGLARPGDETLDARALLERFEPQSLPLEPVTYGA